MTEAEGGYPKVKKRIFRLGYQAPKKYRVKSDFGRIEVKDMHYCKSHNFWYDTEEQDRLLHEGKPCIHTDINFVEGNYNFYGEGSMGWWRRNGISLKSAIRKARKTKNLPLGTIIDISHNCYGTFKKSKKSYSLGYKFKVRNENKFEPDYKINAPVFLQNFNTDDKSKELTDLLRANGFVVAVNSKNKSFISSMIATAAAYTGQSMDVDEEEGEIATAYGHGLRIGYSSNQSTYRGYSYGVKNVLFDKWDEFDKWSRCREISKETPNEEILEILLNVKNEDND